MRLTAITQRRAEWRRGDLIFVTLRGNYSREYQVYTKVADADDLVEHACSLGIIANKSVDFRNIIVLTSESNVLPILLIFFREQFWCIVEYLPYGEESALIEIYPPEPNGFFEEEAFQ